MLSASGHPQSIPRLLTAMVRIAFLLLPAVRCWAQTQQPLVFHDASHQNSVSGPFDEAFDRLAVECMEKYKAPGLSIAFLNGSVTIGKGYGYSKLPFTPATPSTLYYTGSTTKSFTAAAILKLVEDTADSEHPITLSTRVSDLIQFVLPDDYTSSHATLEDLLSHRTGMPRHDLSYGGPNFTLADMVSNLRNLPMTAELRERWQYCNMMYGALTYALETFTGTWLGHLFRDWFWGPLGMRSTFLSLEDARDAAASNPDIVVAQGYAWDNRTLQYAVVEYLTDGILDGAGGIISSVMDYSVYLRALIQKDKRILSEDSYDELRKPRILTGDTPGPDNLFLFSAYGLGWLLGLYRDHVILHHGGTVGGFGSLMVYIPDEEIGIVMMGNSDEGSNLAELVLAMELLQRALGVPDDERLDLRKKIDADLHARDQGLRNKIKALYPAAPSNPDERLPPSLPLAGYTGTYHNKGYGKLTLALAETKDIYNPFHVVESKQVLHADVKDKTWLHELEIEHVNGEHFVAWMHRGSSDTWMFFDALRAEFRVGSNGKPAQLGLGYDTAMGEDKIWFDSVDSTHGF